jgi:hypothetical protein
MGTTARLISLLLLILLSIRLEIHAADFVLNHPAEAKSIYRFSKSPDQKDHLQIIFYNYKNQIEKILVFEDVQGLVIPRTYLYSQLRADGSTARVALAIEELQDLPVDLNFTSSPSLGIVTSNKITFFFNYEKLFQSFKPKGGIIEQIWFTSTYYEGEFHGLMSIAYLDGKNDGLWLVRPAASELFKISNEVIPLGNLAVMIKNENLEIAGSSPISLQLNGQQINDSNIDSEKIRSLQQVHDFLKTEPSAIAAHALRDQIRDQLRGLGNVDLGGLSKTEKMQMLSELLVYELTKAKALSSSLPLNSSLDSRDPYVYFSILQLEASGDNHDFRIYGVAAIERTLAQLKFSESDLKTKEKIFLRVLKLFGNQFQKSTAAYDYLFDRNQVLFCSDLLLL